MNWHKLPEMPTKDKTLCLVNIVEHVDTGEECLEESYYEDSALFSKVVD